MPGESRSDHEHAPLVQSRRSLLASGTALVLGGFAGCTQTGDRTTSAGPANDPSNSLIRETGFEGEYLVVHLREGHDVSEVSLIDSEGSAVAHTEIEPGETKARLQILDLNPGTSDYMHYEPGQYEIITVTDDDRQQSLPIRLEPQLEIDDVQQYREGDSGNELGKVAITVQNSGTAPTWVYEIAYQDSPNTAANEETPDDPSSLLLIGNKPPEQSLVYPDSDQRYIGNDTPLIFDGEGGQSCALDPVNMRVIVGVATGNRVSTQIRVSPSGEVVTTSGIGEYTCSSIEVEVIGSEEDA